MPYRGSAPGFPDIISSKVQRSSTTCPRHLSSRAGGTVGALGVTSPERRLGISDVSAIAETAPGFDAVGFYGITRSQGHPPRDRWSP